MMGLWQLANKDLVHRCVICLITMQPLKTTETLMYSPDIITVIGQQLNGTQNSFFSQMFHIYNKFISWKCGIF